MNTEAPGLIEKERVKRHFLLFRRSYEERMNAMAEEIAYLRKYAEDLARSVEGLENVVRSLEER